MAKPAGKGNGGGGGGGGTTFAVTGLSSDGLSIVGTGDATLGTAGTPITVEIVDPATGTTWSGTTTSWTEIAGVWYWSLPLDLALNTSDLTDDFSDELGSFTVTASYESLHKNGRTKTFTSNPYDLTVEGTPTDTEAPTGSVPDLLDASDSAVSDDNITNVLLATFRIQLDPTVQVGDTVELRIGGQMDVRHDIIQADIDLGYVDLTGTSTGLDEGANQVVAHFYDPAGNLFTSAALAVTLDTVVPLASTPDLVDSSDTGASATDNLTNDATATFSVALTDAAVGDVVVLKVDGVEAASHVLTAGDITAGSVELTVAGLGATGTKSVTAEISDTAGNSSASAALAVEYDGTVPTGSTPDLKDASDSGTNTIDNLTSATAPVFRIGIDASVAEGDLLTLLIGGVDDVSHTITAGDVSNGFVDLAASSGAVAGDGTRTASARIADAAGNESTTGSISVTFDRTAPAAPPAPGLDPTSDSGTADDNVTSDTTPTLSGTAEPGAQVRIYEGAAQIGSGFADGLGNWSITVSALAAGAHALTATAADAAGNVSTASGPLNLTIDTAVSDATISGLTADDGTPDTDGVTGDTTPTIAGTAEAGSGVELFLVGGGSLGTTTAAGSGAWSIQSSALGHGAHQVYAVVTDPAGNSATSANYTFSIDTQAVAEITGITTDSGTAGDNITNDTSPQILGLAEPGSTVTVYPVVGGSPDLASGFAATIGADGAWSADPGTLPEGDHIFRAEVTDPLGNGAWTTDLSVTIDTTVVTATVAQVLVDDGAVEDVLPLPQGSPTADTSPLLRGTAEQLALVEIFIGGAFVGSTQADANGDWEYGLSGLGNGTHTVTLRTTDIAGNIGGGPFDTYTYEITVEAAAAGPHPTTEPLYGEQWNLAAIGDLEAVWQDYSGAGVRFGIYDDGIEYTHVDLDDNYDASAHLIWNSTLLDPAPTTSSEAVHGTAVSGIIAAEANDLGTTGIAWEATLTGVNIFSGPANINEFIDDGRSEGFEWAIAQMKNWDVINHSWGAAPTYLNDTADTTIASMAGAADALASGRGGLGTVILKAAGNWSDSSQGDAFDATRYTITVASYDSDNDASWYSNRGANLLVSAPGSGNTQADASGNLLPGSDLRIATTDRDGGFGYSPDAWSSANDTTGFGGTSAATPTTAGVVGLMLEANPGLGWRDVQTILAYSAHEIGSPTGVQNTATEVVPVDLDTNFTFETTAARPIEYFPGFWNGADNWNGGALHFSEDYGFGSLDGFNAVRMAEVWGLFAPAQTSANEATAGTGTMTPGLSVSGNGSTDSYQFTYSGAAMELEYVDITIQLNTTLMQEVALEVTSPSGTTATLLDVPLNDYTPAFDFFGIILLTVNVDWTFGANAFRGEDPNGTWTVTLTEKDVTFDVDNYGSEADGNTLNILELDFYGRTGAQLADDVYHYTDEMLTLGLAGDAGRRSLDDLSGNDWLNMAAMTSDLLINLQPEASSYANPGLGQTEIVSLATGTVIENAVGGEGSDQIVGNDAANDLAGMRGNDTIEGGAGADDLFGHYGNDELWGGADADRFFFEPGHGDDRIMDFTQGSDLVSLSGFAETQFSQLGFTDDAVNGDKVLTLSSGDSITFAGFYNQTLTTSDFDFGSEFV